MPAVSFHTATVREQPTGNEAAAIPFVKRFTVFSTDQCENPPATDTALPRASGPLAPACARVGTTEHEEFDFRPLRLKLVRHAAQS